MPTISTFHESTFAFFIESTPGQAPGYVAVSAPWGTAAGWASADTGGTADRLRHFEADPTWLKKTIVEDPALVDSVFQTNAPIAGLGPVDGGTIVLGLHGQGAATADASQITETPLMTFLEHCLGGLARGNTTDTDTTVTSDTSYQVAATTNLAEGQLIAIADADAPTRLYSQLITDVTGSVLTLDEAPNFTVAIGDVVHAVATLYPDSDALQTGNGSYTTTSLYYQKGDHNWLGVGCKVQLDSISMARGEQPKLNFTAFAANALPPSTSSISAPTWTGSVEGIPGIVVGARTVLRISDNASTAYVCVDAESFEFEAGVPVVPLDTPTQCNDNMEGRAGYTTQPAPTTITATVFLDTDWQDDFDNLTDVEVTIEQQSAAGKFWCIKLPLASLMDVEYAQSAASNMQTLRFQARERSGTTAITKAKFLIGIG